MKKETTSTRLKFLMSEKNLKQVDILNLSQPYCKKYDVKMNKSDISQYCSGKAEPNQDKLFILSSALNVNEAWLMGFDVPQERISNNLSNIPLILQHYNQLNDLGKHEATKRVKELTYIEHYTQNFSLLNAAHERTDIEITEEMKKHDDAFFDED